MEVFLGAGFIIFSLFGGISLVIRTATRAKIDRLRVEREMWQPQTPPVRHDDTVLAELKALKEQVSTMANTAHQFDISFDAALTRLEGRVERLETKSAAAVAMPTPEAHLRNGSSQ